MSSTGGRYAWCVDDQCMVIEREWELHSVHQLILLRPKQSNKVAPVGSAVSSKRPEPRYLSGVVGWDRCVGGGIMRGTRILLTGRPGIGKSTLLLLVLWSLASSGLVVVYISGEESAEEVGARFRGMGLPMQNNLILHPTGEWEPAMETVARYNPHVVVIDSLHRIKVESCPGDKGDPRQVRRILELIVKVSERGRKPGVVLIGHVAKDGTPVGPEEAMHDITAHLHFSMDNRGLRILRSGKNRQGASGEVAAFEFPPNHQLIREVPDLSELLLRQSWGSEGVVAYPAAASENLARAMAVPIEAFVSPPKGPSDQRIRGSEGVPDKALEDAIDRLGDHGIKLGDRSVRLQAPTVGNVHIVDGGAQLAIITAILASLHKVPLPGVGVFGSLSASGSVVPDPQAEQRLHALARAGAKESWGPQLHNESLPAGMTHRGFDSIGDLAGFVQSRAGASPTTNAPRDAANA